VISVTLAGISIYLITFAFANTLIPISCIPSGNLTNSRELHPLNALSPIRSKELPKWINFRFTSRVNADLEITLTVSGNTIASQVCLFAKPRSAIAMTGFPLMVFGTRTTLSSEVQL